MKANVFTKTLCLTLALSLTGPALPVAVFAQSEEEVKQDTIQIIKGDIYSYTVSNLTRVSVTDPEIADISDAKNEEILLLGKVPGQTILFVWDDDGKHAVTINVVKEDLNLTKSRIDSLLGKAGITGIVAEVSPLEGKVIVSGGASKENKEELAKMLEPFTESIVNVVKEEVHEELIQIDMQITELSTTLSKNIGFDWTNATGDSQLQYGESGLPNNGSKDWFKFGQFNRTTAIVNTINLLVQEGKARDLSRPRILVTSGKEATINVGGEVPIQSTTTSASGGGTTQSDTTFKQYGVTLTVTPTIRNGKIDIVMNAEVSDIDKTFVVKPSETSDIAYKTRSAQTQLLLDDRQTVVFAGLIRYSDSEINKSVPGLGKVPVLGALFRSKGNSTPNEGKELVITLTPIIMRDKEYVKDELKLPTKKLQEFDAEVTQTAGLEKRELPKVDVAPEVVKPVAAAIDNENAITTEYVRGIQQKIAGAISYPQEAIENNVSGTVKLKLTIRRDGFLAGSVVSETSGQNIFDEDALNTAKALVPYPKFPKGLLQDSLTVTIPIVYSQTTK